MIQKIGTVFLTFILLSNYFLNTTGYGDVEINEVHDEETTSANFYQRIAEQAQYRHRARRSVSNSTDTTVVVLTTQSNSPGIYIITSFNGSASTSTTTTTTSTTTTETTTTTTSTTTTETTTTIISTTTSRTTTTSETTTTISTTTSTMNATTTTQSTTTTTTTMIPCLNNTHFLLLNGTCASRDFIQNQTAQILNNIINTTNPVEIANALSTYTESTAGLRNLSNSSTFVPLEQLDKAVAHLLDSNITLNTTNTLVTAMPTQRNDSLINLGASFIDRQGGTIVDTQNEPYVINTNLSSAAIFANASVTNIRSMAIVIISSPTIYLQVDNTTSQTVASHIVIVDAKYINASNPKPPVILNLFFQVLKNMSVPTNAEFTCSYFETTNQTWNQWGCSKPIFNRPFQRYECECYHLTSFALIWTRRSVAQQSTSDPPELNAADIASLTTLAASIICFIILFGYLIVDSSRSATNSEFSINLRISMPFVAYGITALLFIFYIALTTSVYNRNKDIARSVPQTSPVNEYRAASTDLQSSSSFDSCTKSEQGLAIFTYLLLMLMFTVKTCCGYFSYAYFATAGFITKRKQKLVISIITCCSLPLVLMTIVAGLASNPNNRILIIIGLKICWFSPDVIHFFLTIPIVGAIVINIVLIVLIFTGIIRFRNGKTENDPNNDNKIFYKRLSTVLIASFFTQGVGWIFGPLISLSNESAGDVLQWFFIILNAAEGVWVLIIAYFSSRYKLHRVKIHDEEIKEELYSEKRASNETDKHYPHRSVSGRPSSAATIHIEMDSVGINKIHDGNTQPRKNTQKSISDQSVEPNPRNSFPESTSSNPAIFYDMDKVDMRYEDDYENTN